MSKLKNTGSKSKISPVALYSHNKKECKKNYAWFECYYKDYTNQDKILILLEYWLYSFRVILDLYGLQGAKKYCLDSKTGCPYQFSWLEEDDVDIRSNNKRFNNKYLFKVLSMFHKYYTIPGASIYSIFDKINWRVSKRIIFSTPIAKSSSRRSDLVKKLSSSLAGYKVCLLYTSPSPRDRTRSRMPSSA